MIKFFYFLFILVLIYSCSPINKQHGYLLDDLLISSDKISKFEINKTSRNEIYSAMGSPSIEIRDINNIWIYLISLNEKNIFENDELLFQNIYRFTFNDNGFLIDKQVLSQENFNNIIFASEKTKVNRDAYGITDQLYDAFTRGQ